ncbi:hypothetical protein E8E13_006346 [Curvularia kusanoi]|uniref:Wings apart-like protein C-terminal domain-containing protein n=1 Tax=Curvularia kusanoi TaxID=90978 RepID=A0A9P4W8V9_CURKU|nr:hypothetical protein E8E13_006346 [Curvularia kusanoi]
MASFTSSTFATGDKRKKVITYGKLSRLPPPRPSLLDDGDDDSNDAPLPQRPHNYAVTSTTFLAGSRAEGNDAQSHTNARATMASPDVFDVPSEDEFDFPPTTPAKRPIAQRRKTEGNARAGGAIEAKPPGRSTVAAINPQKPAIVRPPVTKTKPSQERAKAQRAVSEKGAPAEGPSSSSGLPTKASQAALSQKQVTTNNQRLHGSNTSTKHTSRATTPGLPAQVMPKPRPTKPVSTARSDRAAKSSNKPSATSDIFDVPSDGEDVSVPIPKALTQTPRQPLKSTMKEAEAAGVPLLIKSRKAPTSASELGSLQNRKRKGSVNLTAAAKSSIERAQNAPIAQQDRKVAKRDEGTSASHESTRVNAARPAPSAAAQEHTINKPKRTRTRTVPYVNQRTMTKGQSSPAVLHRMLPVEQPSKSSYQDAPAEVPASDDTMYDIPDATTPPARSSLRKSGSLTPGSVTPRQRNLFSTLLEDTKTPKTPASALASLQLSEKKPSSLLGALARSKSDVSHASHSRKARLIDTLKDKESSSEEDSESDCEDDSTLVADDEVDADRTPVQVKRTFVPTKVKDELQIAGPTAEDSQTSQAASVSSSRPKLTYARNRSMLGAANPEDEFLLSMDLDDSSKMDSQTMSTDDEDEPTSQPRTHHELRKYGQNTMFSWDMEESIREISESSNRSGRRSAIMELCTKMADAGFISQLLDSGFMHKLLDHILSPGDTIFDFVAAVSILFILQTKPAFAVVDQIQHSGVTKVLMALVDNDTDVSRIARDRKSNMSKIAQESLSDFCALVLASQEWTPCAPEQMSPQVLALQTLDILTRSLRESGSTDALLTPADVSKVVNVCSISTKRVQTSKFSARDLLVINLAISVLETVSIADQDYTTWSTKILQQLSDCLPVLLKTEVSSKTVEAMKLCMHITNNKPKSCQPFSTPTFIKCLVDFIVARFHRLDAHDLDAQDRARAMAELTLGLGAMINLAELSDQARLHAISDANAVKRLVETFQVGAERAAEATSVEESSVSVVIGFLAVLLGMICLNPIARTQIQQMFPDGRLHPLLDIMKQIAQFNEHVDKQTAKRFDGPEGQKTLNNYYTRIMHVVQKLESTEA